MVEIVGTYGYEALTVRRLAKRARISSGTFYNHYRSTDDCLLSTFDLICQRATQRMMKIGQDEPESDRRLESAVVCLFQDIAAAPQIATFMLRAAPAAGPAFTSGLRNSAMRLGAALEFCICSDDSPPLHPLLLEGVVAGLARIGRVLVPRAGEEEIRGAAAEAVAWIRSLRALSIDAEASSAAAPPERRKGLSVPGRLRSGEWERALGDERAMILTAAFRIARSGYHQLTIPRICREAGVSRRDFNRHFRDLHDCFIAALENHATEALATSLHEQPASATTWSDTVYGALEALCSAIEDDRDSARALFIEITAAGTQGIDSRDRLISEVARTLRTTAPAGQGPSELAAEASAAAAWAIVRRRVQDQSSATTAALPVLALLMGNPAVRLER